MTHLALFKIKDPTFDYTRYGLSDVFFSLDVVRNISPSKNTTVTSYPVLDGTTRADNISEEKGTFNLTGVLTDIHHAPDKTNFVKSTSNVSRVSVQIALLKALRTNAVFLDIITEDEVFKDYVLTGISYGKESFGTVNVSLSFTEIIMFGDDIDIRDLSDRYQIPDPLGDIETERFRARAMNSDIDLIRECNRIVTTSDLRTPHIHIIGSPEMNADVLIEPIKYKRFQRKLTSFGNVFKYTTEAAVFSENTPARRIVTGVTDRNYFLDIEIPLLKKDGIVIPKIPDVHSPRLNNIILPLTSLYDVKISLKQYHETGYRTLYTFNSRDLIIPAKFSFITNGIHPLTNVLTYDANGLSNDYIADYSNIKGYEYGLSFMRKTTLDTYKVFPNLLRDKSLGYLYAASYEVSDDNVNSRIQMALVYIQPDALEHIKNEMTARFKESSYFRNKKFIWW